MATVAVAADNNRVAIATIATDAGTWGNDGGGGAVADEPDIVYQGTTSQSRKVSTSLIGRSYDDSAGAGSVDATAADRRHFLFKLNCTNYTALNTRTTPGTTLKIGSGSGDYHRYYLFGSDNYPVAGGWQFVPVSVNVTGYQAGLDVGTPVDTAVDYYSWLGDYTATAKAENHVIDAIDQGRGLKLTGGDGASTDGVWADFLTADEGTSGNRWGYVRSLDGIFFCIGELSIGENTSETAVATVFQDATGQVLVWENGLVETGFHKFRVNLGSATTDIDITAATFDSVGQKDNDGDRGYTTTEDSRLQVEATGTSGACNFIGCTFKNLNTMTLTSAVTVDACDIEVEDLLMAGAEINNDTIIRTTSITQVATLTDGTFGVSTDLNNTAFVQAGAGHAIELDTVGSVTFTNITFSGYGGTKGSNLTPASGASDAEILNSSGGAITINISGGDTPAIRNTSGSTTTVVNTKTITLDNVVPGSQCAVYATSGGPETVGTELMNKTAVPSSHGDMLLDGVNEYIESSASALTDLSGGDLEMTMLVKPVDWSDGGTQVLCSQRDATAGTRAMRWQLSGTGAFQLLIHDGVTETTYSTAAVSYTNNVWLWLRLTFDASAGAVSIESSTDANTTDVNDIQWTEDFTPSGAARNIQSLTTVPILVGANNSTSPNNFFNGNIAYLKILAGAAPAVDKILEADWRVGPDFTGSPSIRPDDHDPNITWEEAGGTPVYTVASTTKMTVTQDYAYTSDQPINIFVRQSSFAPKQESFFIPGTVTTNGSTTFVLQSEDTVAT
jgi:hypothetical protein